MTTSNGTVSGNWGEFEVAQTAVRAEAGNMQKELEGLRGAMNRLTTEAWQGGSSEANRAYMARCYATIDELILHVNTVSGFVGNSGSELRQTDNQIAAGWGGGA